MTNFEVMVLRMRQAQKEYYRTRSQHILQECKKLEKQVDDYLFVCDQPDLFGSGNANTRKK